MNTKQAVKIIDKFIKKNCRELSDQELLAVKIVNNLGKLVIAKERKLR